MAYAFSPFTGTLDYYDPVTPPTPNIVAAGINYNVPDNTQVTYSGQIYVQAGGVVSTSGSGVLSWVN